MGNWKVGADKIIYTQHHCSLVKEQEGGTIEGVWNSNELKVSPESTVKFIKKSNTPNFLICQQYVKFMFKKVEECWREEGAILETF
jgi:hypothetical protein